MTHKEIAETIVEIGRRMWQRGYVAASDGNISARLDDNHVMITPTGVSKGFMKPEEMAVVDMVGHPVEGTGRASTEVFMHLAIYQNRPDVQAVCHTHSPLATAFAVAGIPLDFCLLPEVIIWLGSVPLVSYGTVGTEEIYRPLIDKLDRYDAFLLEKHGVVTVGKNLLEAYYKTETVEHFAKVVLAARQLGPVKELPKEEVEKLIRRRPVHGIRDGLAGCEAED